MHQQKLMKNYLIKLNIEYNDRNKIKFVLINFT